MPPLAEVDPYQKTTTEQSQPAISLRNRVALAAGNVLALSSILIPVSSANAQENNNAVDAQKTASDALSQPVVRTAESFASPISTNLVRADISQVAEAGTKQELMDVSYSSGTKASASKLGRVCLHKGLSRPKTYLNEIEHSGKYAQQINAISLEFKRLPKKCGGIKQKAFGLFQAKRPSATIPNSNRQEWQKGWRNMSGGFKRVKVYREDGKVFGQFIDQSTYRHKPGNRIYTRPGEEVVRFLGLIKLFNSKNKKIGQRLYTDRSKVYPDGRGKPIG